MLRDDVERIVRDRPGSTATELAKALYGVDGYQERINQVLRGLCAARVVERRGSGGPGDPYRYFPAARRRRAGDNDNAQQEAQNFGPNAGWRLAWC